MVLAGTDGPIVTPIKALLTPQKMQDLRVKVSSIYSLLPRSRADQKRCRKMYTNRIVLIGTESI